MRHDDGDAPIEVRERRDAERRAARIRGIGKRELAGCADVAHSHQPARGARARGGVAHELGAPLAVRHRHRQHGARHPGQQHGRRRQHLHQREARLVLLAAVPDEARPVCRAGDDALERSEHLTAVADAECEAVLAGEESLELLAHRLVEQDRLRPSLARAEHISVGEAATRHESLELPEVAHAAEQVCHVDVVRRETAAVEHRGGLGLAVDTLLAQYGDRRAHPARDVRSGDVVRGIEAEGDLEGRLLRGAHRGKFFVRALWVIAQPPQLPRGLRPGAPQLHQALIEQRVSDPDPHLRLAQRRSQAQRRLAEPVTCEGREEGRLIARHDLHHDARLLGEQLRERCAPLRRERNVQPAVPGKCHLHERREQSAIGAIVVGAQQAVVAQLVERRGELRETLRLIEVCRLVAELAVHLRKRRAPQAVAAAAEVDEPQRGRPLIVLQDGGKRGARIAHRRERRHDERHRGDHALLHPLRAPARAHRQRVLADRNRDPELRAQLLRDRVDRGVECRVLARLAGGGHPVGRQADLRQRADVGGEDVGDGLGHREPTGSRRIEHRHRCALAHRHRLPGRAAVIGERHRHIAHRHLPGADQLVTADESADGAVADGDEKGLVGYCGQTQHAVGRLAQLDPRCVEAPRLQCQGADIPREARRLAEQQLDRHVDGTVLEQRIAHREAAAGVDFADHRERAALARRDGGELRQRFGLDHQHVALLRLVAPQLHR